MVFFNFRNLIKYRVIRMSEKIKFPDGREINIHEVLSFLYNLGDSEILVLHKLLTSNTKSTAEELAEEFKVSKASINKALNNLLSKGLIEREKVLTSGKKGRPIYVYSVNKEIAYKKICNDVEKVTQNIKDLLRKNILENKVLIVTKR